MQQVCAKERRIKGVCRKCGAVLQVKIGDLTPEQVKAKLRKRTGYHCPGYHVELGNMYDGYDWDFSVYESAPVMSDEEWIRKLQSEGTTVIDGAREFPFLKSIHDIPDLKHIGFGYFESRSCIYERADSPRGTRFYTETEK